MTKTNPKDNDQPQNLFQSLVKDVVVAHQGILAGEMLVLGSRDGTGRSSFDKEALEAAADDYRAQVVASRSKLGHWVLPQVFLTMDGRRRARELDIDHRDQLVAEHAAVGKDWKVDMTAHQVQDLEWPHMHTLMVNPCPNCGSREFTVGDFVCWGTCYTCISAAEGIVRAAEVREDQRDGDDFETDR